MSVTEQITPSVALLKIPSLSHLIITWKLYKGGGKFCSKFFKLFSYFDTDEKWKGSQKKLANFLPL